MCRIMTSRRLRGSHLSPTMRGEPPSAATRATEHCAAQMHARLTCRWLHVISLLINVLSAGIHACNDTVQHKLGYGASGT